jgi:carboxyl-terminal processing protease
METMILDLRGNGGGLLNEAVNIVNFFVDKGQEVVSTKGKVKQWDRVHKALNEPLDKEIPLTILIDEMSASASEIVSGALQDLDRAVVIGRKSFGKGLVQQTRSLSYNSKLKVTVAKYYIPSGRCIQKLDYSHKDEKGKAGEIPDSLKSEFKTSNGRIVFDGGGIEPDVKVDEENFANITFSLLSKQLIFDYASEFRAKKDSIKKPYEFEFTDEDYMAFKEFIKDKEYDYTTQTEKLLNDLKEAAEKEKVHTNFQDEFNALEAELKQNKAGDVDKFKDEISRIIENEIISRYYYQSGRIESELKYDKDIAKALELLKNKDQFESILAGTFAKKD